MAGKSKRRSPSNYRFRKAKEDVGVLLEEWRRKPAEDELKEMVTLIVGKWELDDEPGIEDWFRFFILLECDKRWKVMPEMPEPVLMPQPEPKSLGAMEGVTPLPPLTSNRSHINWDDISPVKPTYEPKPKKKIKQRISLQRFKRKRSE